jgi:hypothetical protein
MLSRFLSLLIAAIRQRRLEVKMREIGSSLGTGRRLRLDDGLPLPNPVKEGLLTIRPQPSGRLQGPSLGNLFFAHRSWLLGFDQQLQQVAHLGFRNRWKSFELRAGTADALSGNSA